MTTTVYFGGKVAKNDWRHGLVRHLRKEGGMDYAADIFDAVEPWPILQDALGEGIDYCGPYFISCDHGCFHGANTHGVGTARSNEGAWQGKSRQQVLKLCKTAIGHANFVYAWLDDPTAFGTLFELGYAHALGKTVAIAHPPGYEYANAHWFTLTAADYVVASVTPAHGWMSVCHHYGLGARNVSERTDDGS